MWFKCLSHGGQVISVVVAMMIKNPRRVFLYILWDVQLVLKS